VGQDTSSATAVAAVPVNDELMEPLVKLGRTRFSKTRGAGGSIKPGVELSVTPGSVEIRNEPAKQAAAALLWVCHRSMAALEWRNVRWKS
jgi:hypothetical protein